MRICFVAHSSREGGADLVLIETIEILQTEGIECRVLLPDRGELCAALGRLGVPFSVVPYAHWMSRGRVSLFRLLWVALNIAVKTTFVAWKVFRWECSAVYTNTATICVGAFAARLLGLPHVWHLHEFGLEDQGLSFLFGERFSLAAINRLSSICICVSKALARRYAESIEPRKITVIYPSMHRALSAREGATDEDSPAFRRSGRFRCLIVGTLMEGKGQIDSILALVQLRQMGIDAELMIVGDGLPGYRGRLQEIILRHDLTEFVTLAGRVDNALPAMRSSDAVLVCSRREAFGRVTIEAMLAGKAVLGARSGATAELIKDGVNGLLYDSGDAKDLANKIKYLYGSPRAAETLGRNAQAWVEGYFTKSRYREELWSLLAHLHDPAVIRIRVAPSA
jgi:glycosyltransferase involved in cell wall biosynthesis